MRATAWMIPVGTIGYGMLMGIWYGPVAARAVILAQRGATPWEAFSST